jgi:hypothetical protein
MPVGASASAARAPLGRLALPSLLLGSQSTHIGRLLGEHAIANLEGTTEAGKLIIGAFLSSAEGAGQLLLSNR